MFQENVYNGRDFETNPVTVSYSITHQEEQDGRHTLANVGFHDVNTQELVRFVTFTLEMKKAGSNETMLHLDAYHTQDGTITFDMLHVEGEPQVYATREDFLNAYKVDPATGTIRMILPLQADSTYLMHLELVSIENIRQFLPVDQRHTIDMYFSTNEDKMDQVMIVPEFPYHVVLIVSAVIGSFIAISRTGLLARYYGTGK